MSAEFHLPTPVVPTRECYFARYCRQFSRDQWGVVDVSLEKFFPSPSNNLRKRPSGCLITGMPNGHSKVVNFITVLINIYCKCVNFSSLSIISFFV